MYDLQTQYHLSEKTGEQLEIIENERNRLEFIREKSWPAGDIVSSQYYESWHLLFLPIKKTKQVSRIIVHHEGVVLGTDLTDEEVIKNIYKNHVRKWWWDIAYHYIIWQRGKIYEWRAGGDYVVWTHAVSNNIWTVWIVILWNYTENNLNRDQIQGIKKLIKHLAKKYGITLSQNTYWFECSDAHCKTLDLVPTKSLLGHRDVKNTNCPWDNVYPLITQWIWELDNAYVPVFNTQKKYIQKPPPERIMNTKLKGEKKSVLPEKYVQVIQTQKRVRYIWPKFRVKLSYPNDASIILSSQDGKNPVIKVDSKKIPQILNQKVNVWILWNNILEIKIGENTYTGKEIQFSHSVVRIDSWSRIPDWDKTKKYNDNLFRDTIRVIAQDGKLLVVNDLPLEWYLKGMGEVSNGDHSEKIKTIVVAARSYARWYMDPSNRKFSTPLYDGSDNPDEFQKYLWYSYELRSPNVSKMVDFTRNQVITYSRYLIKPWYFSSSDGKTLSYKEYCEKNTGKICEDIPYLQSVEDPAWLWKVRAGHGVGISGIGATYFANQWWDYKKIIQYYLAGVEISKK